MKKLILICCALFITFLQQSFAQCTPDTTLTYNGISPETLPDAMAGYEYWSTLTFKIPKDSAVSIGSSNIAITIDKAQLLYVSGVPSGFKFDCNEPTCTWAGGTRGCALFNGKVDSTYTDSVTEINMKIYVKTWYRFTGGTEQFDRIDSNVGYVFRINKYNGIATISPYEMLTAYPNPTTGKVNIELRDTYTEDSEVKIVDAFGKLIYQNTVPQNQQFLNRLEVDLSSYPQGLYMVYLKSGDRLGMSKVVLR